jgi:hypothetical protein
MCIVAPKPISTAYFINPSHQSVYPPIIAMQQLSRHVPVATNTCNNRTVDSIIFYVACVILKESLWVCLCITLTLLGNGSVNIFPQQQWIVGGVVFYVVYVVSKESRLVFLTITSCYCTILYELFSFPPPFPPQHTFNIQQTESIFQQLKTTVFWLTC